MRKPSSALVVSTIALAVALTGTAGAAGLIDGHTIKDHSITASKLSKGAVTARAVAPHAIHKSALADGVIVNNTVIAPVGPQGPAGVDAPAIAGPAGPTGTPGSARAWGYVAGDGTVDPARSSGIDHVTKLAGSGDYCIYLSASASVLVVNTVVGSGSAPLQAGSSGLDPACSSSTGYRVRTFTATGTAWAAVDTPFVLLAA